VDISTIEDQVAAFPKPSQPITQQYSATPQKNRDLTVNNLS